MQTFFYEWWILNKDNLIKKYPVILREIASVVWEAGRAYEAAQQTGAGDLAEKKEIRYYQHGETGRVVATEGILMGEWYRIEKYQYEVASHSLSLPTPLVPVAWWCPQPCNRLHDSSQSNCVVCGSSRR